MIFARKINKIPEFYMIYAQKTTKCPNFTWFLPEKCFSPDFFWGGSAPSPLSYAYVQLQNALSCAQNTAVLI